MSDPIDPIDPAEPITPGTTGSHGTPGSPDTPGPLTPAEVQEAEAIDYPMVNEEVEAGAVPLSQRLRNPRAIVSIVLPIVVLLLVLVALPGFHLDQLPSLILNANPWWLLAAVGIYYVGFPLRGYRWALLIRGTGYPLRTRDATEIIFISWLVNCVVPAKLGDVYRGYLLRVTALVALSTSFGTIFIERVFDLFAIVILGLMAGYWSLHNNMNDTVRIIFGFGLVVVALLAVGLFVVRNFGRSILERLPVPHRIVAMYDLFEQGVFSVERRKLPLIAVVTALIWTTEALRLYFVVLALHFAGVDLGISGAFFVALTASLLTAIPFTPAGVGIVEGGMIFLLVRIYSVDQTQAAAIVLLDRVISVLSIIVLGSIVYVISSKTKSGGRLATTMQSSTTAGAPKAPTGPASA
jgi:uncharacterized protein (TIRG00374 family)